MRAIRFHALGDANVLQLEDAPDPTPKPGEALVRVRAIGVNFADTMFRQGTYFQKPVFPQIPGMEAAGEVVALGEGTQGLAIGDRVMVLGENAYAELMIARPNETYPMPSGLDFVRAAALPVQGLTAYHCLGHMARLQPGESVLVHAGAGGVGSLAIQLAKSMGVGRVIATAGGADKCQLVRALGADVAIDYREEDWLPKVKEATSGRGVDVILEMLGGNDVYKKNLACLAPLGRMIVYGAASGDTRGTVTPIGLMGKNHTVSGYYLTPLLRRRGLCAPALEAVARDVVDGRVRVVISREAKLAEAAAMHQEVESRRTTGKIVLVP
jgi:NADPH2:quinone reductase